MIRTPSGKNLMNEHEAIQWLLDNNALPFQCTADYVGGAEIGLGTIVNPTPAKVRVGSLIFFADSKVSTVIAITSNSFICSEEYNDLVDDVVYVSNVQLNASGHLIVTLSNGTDVDAGLVKQISSFSINDSQHLIATYNNGTTQDLGAIFSGNITISGNLTVTADVSCDDINCSTVNASGQITGYEILELNTGYTYAGYDAKAGVSINPIYMGISKTGNKLTIVEFLEVTRTGDVANNYCQIFRLGIPSQIGSKLYPATLGTSPNVLNSKYVNAFNEVNNHVDCSFQLFKPSNSALQGFLYNLENLTLNTTYQIRIENTLLLSDNLIP